MKGATMWTETRLKDGEDVVTECKVDQLGEICRLSRFESAALLAYLANL